MFSDSLRFYVGEMTVTVLLSGGFSRNMICPEISPSRCLLALKGSHSKTRMNQFLCKRNIWEKAKFALLFFQFQRKKNPTGYGQCSEHCQAANSINAGQTLRGN